jgi:glutamate 5-kinase
MTDCAWEERLVKIGKKRIKPDRKKNGRWVVKVGSNLICSGGPLLVRALMQQVSQLRRLKGTEIIWVTSGAIASAVERLGYEQKEKTLADKQALSAIGQPLLMDLYNLSLQAHGLMGAQVLITYDDLVDEKRKQNLINTLKKLLDWQVVPILNENDAVATEEIKFGDNDSLSARVAKLVEADHLVILTDVEGLYTQDPAEDPKAQRIYHLKNFPLAMVEQMSRGAGSSRGTGGMYSKMMAARDACEVGIETWLVRGDVPGILLKVAAQESVGTRIEAKV